MVSLSLVSLEEFTLVGFALLCVPMWCCGTVSCGNPSTLSLCSLCYLHSLRYDPFSVISLNRARNLILKNSSPSPNPRDFTILFSMSLCRQTFYLKIYLIVWDSWAHLGGSSALCGIGCGPSGSCVQLGACLGWEHLICQLGWLAWVEAGQASLTGWLDFYHAGSRAPRAARQILRSWLCHPASQSHFYEGNDQWCHGSYKDEHWEKATSWTIERCQ